MREVVSHGCHCIPANGCNVRAGKGLALCDAMVHELGELIGL